MEGELAVMIEAESTCHTCELTKRRDAGIAPLWDGIYRTPFWDVVHAYNTSLLGWLVLIARRHVRVLADLTEAEAVAMGGLVRHASVALQELTGCAKTYVVQFAEARGHQHVHCHIIPRMADLSPDLIGPGIFKHLGVPDDQRVSTLAMDGLASQVRMRLEALSSPHPS